MYYNTLGYIIMYCVTLKGTKKQPPLFRVRVEHEKRNKIQ